MEISHIKANAIGKGYIGPVKVQFGTFKAAPGTVVVPQLTVVVKIIFHFFTAAFAEPAFPDLPGIFFPEHLLTDAEGEMRIFIFQSQIGG